MHKHKSTHEPAKYACDSCGSSRFYHLYLSLFSNFINISNLNSDNLFVNNHEDEHLSTINICLLHCARISCS